jgi:hypothetical protein
MNNIQKQHLIDIQTRFIAEHSTKYKAGAKEHKTILNNDFNSKQLLAFLKEEVLDLVSYVYTLEELMEQENGTH